MSHIFMSHVTHMHESCHTYARVTSHTCTNRVTHMHESCQHSDESCHTRVQGQGVERVPEGMGHVTHINTSCHTYARVKWHMCMRARCECECVMSHNWMHRVMSHK